jgi:hypothetical protein
MSWYKPWTWGDESDSSKEKRNDLNLQGAESSAFADDAQTSFLGMRGAMDAQRAQLGDIASGKDSLSGEQLRQGLQQNLSTQRSMAASAAPRDAAMAARTAAIQGGRMGYGMSGQAALAGIQERASARDQLTRMLMEQRQQELQAALQARQNAISGYGGVTPEQSGLEKMQPLINAGIGIGSAALGRK